MQARADTTFHTEATERDQSVRPGGRLPIHNNTAPRVDVGELRLQSIETVGRAYTEAYVALEVTGMVLGGLLAGPVLREIFGCVHDKLELVRRVGHGLGIDPSAKKAIRRGEEDEGLIVEGGKDHLLKLDWKTLQQRRAVGGAWRVGGAGTGTIGGRRGWNHLGSPVGLAAGPSFGDAKFLSVSWSIVHR